MGVGCALEKRNRKARFPRVLLRKNKAEGEKTNEIGRKEMRGRGLAAPPARRLDIKGTRHVVAEKGGKWSSGEGEKKGETSVIFTQRERSKGNLGQQGKAGLISKH